MRRLSFLLMALLLGGAIVSVSAQTEAVIDSIDEPLFSEAELDTVFAADSTIFADSAYYPAAELYRYVWTSQRLNPYGVKIDSLPDSTLIDVSTFVYPTLSTRITSGFGQRRWRWHYGTDLGVCVGDTIVSMFSGRIRIIDFERRGYGRYVVVRHDNGLESVYAHMSRVLVSLDQRVEAGEPIGLAGNTGRSTGPHLHFEVRLLGNAFDTRKLIDFENRTTWNDSLLITIADTYSHNAALKELSKAVFHTIRSGDTLSGLARKYGTRVSTLCKMNKISTKTVLRIGRKIRVR